MTYSLYLWLLVIVAAALMVSGFFAGDNRFQEAMEVEQKYYSRFEPLKTLFVYLPLAFAFILFLGWLSKAIGIG